MVTHHDTSTLLELGASEIRARRLTHPPSHVAFINLHQNETTSIAAAQALLQTHPGRLHTFEQAPERPLTFRAEGEEWRVDPNRIFSPAGVRGTLLHYHGRAPEPVVTAVCAFTERLLAWWELTSAKLVVAVHNTGDDYSVLSYQPGGDEASSAAAVNVVPNHHRHDFFFVTEGSHYRALVEQGFNAVLQKPHGPDDGSLSVYCGARAIPYVNVEARYHEVENQRRMLLAAWELHQIATGHSPP